MHIVFNVSEAEGRAIAANITANWKTMTDDEYAANMEKLLCVYAPLDIQIDDSPNADFITVGSETFYFAK